MQSAAVPVPQTFVECCQWFTEIDRDLHGVVEELRRMNSQEEEREEHQGRFKIIDIEVQRLIDELRTRTAISMDARKSSMITSFVDKIVWSWEDGSTWIRYESNQLKVNCVHLTPRITLGGAVPLYDFVIRRKRTIHEIYRFLYATKKQPTWHPQCIQNFNTLHDVILPKLSLLLHCDGIRRDLSYYKQATLYRQHQLFEIQSFNSSLLQTPDTSSPDPLAIPSTETKFSPLYLPTGELLGEDPLDISDQPLTYPEPLSYQAFKSLPAPVPLASCSQLPKGRPGRPASDAQGGNHALGEPKMKGPKAPRKKRGPYKKRDPNKKKDKPVVVTCELVKVRKAPIKILPKPSN